MTTWDEVRAIWRVAKHRPTFTILIAGFGVVTALLEGVGLSFILPIIEFARSPTLDTSTLSGPMAVFSNAYHFLGIPFTFEFVIMGVIVVLGLRYAASIAMEWARVLLQVDYERSLKISAFDQAVHASIPYFDDQGSDEILNAIVTQATQASVVIARLVSALQQSLLSLMYLAIALYFAPILTVLAAVGFGGITYIVRFVIEPGQQIGARLADANEEIQTAVQAGTQGIRDVKLFGMLQSVQDRFLDAIEKRVMASVAQKRNRAIIRNVYQFASALTLFVLIYFAISVSSLSIASLGVFLFAMFRLAPRISGLNGLVYEIENQMPHLVRTQEFIDELADHREPDDGSNEPPDPVTTIAFEDVSFGYGEGSNDLEDVTFTVNREEFVGFVGQSGAGKSTIVSLISRMYEPDEGTITANGIPIDTIDLRKWRQKLAIVRQQPYIFNETLLFNLTIGNPSVSSEEVRKACEIAQVTEFVDDLPRGYETRLGDDGVKLSGGQRQRVALARALLKQADVLILDEATSDLDSEIEARVQDAIENMDQAYAIVTIAHRLSTVINADRIYTMEDGRIIEAGPHEDLISRGGTYTNLYYTQVKGG